MARSHYSAFTSVSLFVLGMFSSLAAHAGELHDAVRAGDADRIKVLLASGAAVDESDLDGSALHIAVGLGSEKIIRLLLEGGSDIEIAIQPSGDRPLHLASLLNSASAAELLLAHGAQANAQDSQGRTPLMIAATRSHPDVVVVLLNHGADVHIRDSVYSETALHMSAFTGNIEIVRLLLSKGAKVDERSGANGQTPLFYAGHHGHLEIVKLFLAEGADLNAKDKEGGSVLKWAVSPAKEYFISLGLKE